MKYILSLCLLATSAFALNLNESRTDLSGQSLKIDKIVVSTITTTDVYVYFATHTVVNGDVYSAAWVDYGGTSSVAGWVATPAINIWYKKVGNLVFVIYNITGTSNATSASFTLPYTSVSGSSNIVRTACQAEDNGVFLTTPGYLVLAANSATVNVYKDFMGAAWTNNNGKTIGGQFWYEAAP